VKENSQTEVQSVVDSLRGFVDDFLNGERVVEDAAREGAAPRIHDHLAHLPI